MQIESIQELRSRETESEPLDKHRHDHPRQDPTSVSLAAIFQTIGRNRRPFAIVAASTFLTLVAIAFILPNTYSASASFIPPSNNTGGLSSLASQLSAVGGGALMGTVKNGGDLYVGMLGSHTIASRLVSRFNLMSIYNVSKESKAINKLWSRSRFELGVRDGIVTINITDRSAARARDLANAYLEELQRVNGHLALSEAAQRRLFFEQQLAREKDLLADAEVAMKVVQEQTGLVSPSGQTQVGLATIAQTRAGIASRQVQLAGLRFSSTDQDPQVLRLQSEISALEGQLANLQKGVGSSNSVDIPSSRVPQVELEFIRRERDVKYHEALFQMISKQYEAARLDESHDAPTLQILDLATLPDTRSGPQRTMIIGAGFVLGLLIGVIWVLARDRSWMPRGRFAE